MAVDVVKLTADLIAAREAAALAVEGLADKGTCNHDVPWLHVRRSPRVLRAIESAGLGHYGGSQLLISGTPGDGRQGWAKTCGAEAFVRALADRGWGCSVRYMLD